MATVMEAEQLTAEKQRRWRQWWDRKGLVLWLTARRDVPGFDAPAPPPTDDLAVHYMDPQHQVKRRLHDISRTAYFGEAFPFISLCIGPGDLALYMGSEPGFSPSTVWYHPCIGEPPEAHPPLKINRNSRWLNAELEMARLGVADGRFAVGMPDLLENFDILAAMRDPQVALMDLIERPEWCLEKIDEINAAFFEAFELFNDIIKLPEGGNVFAAFNIWGPGRTAKVQCDALAMISPAMSGKFVMPALQRQCAWLDYSLFHLDGEQALCHLDNLLAVDSLSGIEWTPVGCCRGEGGGRPEWYELYKRILSAGKSVQAIGVKHTEVIPLLDAVGPAGMYIMTGAPDQRTAEELAMRVEAYR